MRLSLAQKVTLPLLGFGAQGDALEYLQSLGDWAALWDFQDPSGLVALAYNNEIPVGRQLALLTYADYTAGAGWSNSGGEVALHTAGSVATLSQAGLLAVGKTFALTTIISGRTAGTVTPTGGTAISATTVGQPITATGTALEYTPTTDFDGSIDLALVVLKQTGILASSSYPGAELLVDGDMEAATTAAWAAAGDSTLSKETGTRTGGSGTQVLKIAHNTDVNPNANQTKLTIGKRYKATGWARSDGNATPRLLALSVFWTGVNTHTNWQEFDIEFVATNVRVFLQSFTITGTEYTEWDDVSVTPANPFNGDNDGATVNQPLQPGIVAYSFDSVNDEVVVKSAELNSGITPLAGTMVALFKIGTAVWEDSTIRTLFRIYVDATNYITMKKGANVGEVIASYAGEGAAAVDIAHSTLSPLGTISMIITFDIVANELKMYLQGTQHGATGAITAVMLGNITSAVIGSTGAGEYWDELVAHVGFMRRLMTATEIATYTGMLNLESGTAFDAGFDEGFI